MLDPRQVFECTLPATDASDVIRIQAPTEEDDGESSSFIVAIGKSCVLVQGDGEVISLPCDAPSASLSPDGMVVVGWTSANMLHGYYGGEAILSRAVDLPSSAWKTFLVKSRVASASLFEFVLLVVCIDGSICRVRIQSAHVSIQLLAQVSQSHPTLTACDVRDNGRLLVLAGGIRSNAKDMEHGSSLSIWNVLDESAELLHYSTVLAHDKTILDDGVKADSSSSWWSLLSSAEQLYPGYIQDVAISPDNTLVALRDSSGHVSIRQVDTCATIVPWTLVADDQVRSLCWFHPQQLVVAVASKSAPLVCSIQDDALTVAPAPLASSAPASSSLSHALANSSSRFYHLVCHDVATALWKLVAYQDVPVSVVFSTHVAQGRFDVALALAAVHSLDADVVHKAAWHKFLQQAATLAPADLAIALDAVLTNYVANMEDKAWATDSIKRTILDTPAACHRLWTFGLTLDGASDVGLQQLLDRLDTFLQLLAAETSNDDAFDLTSALDALADCFDVASFQQYLDLSWVDIARALATAGRVPALTVLFARHGYHVLPYRFEILHALPASIPPRDFQHLLPAIPLAVDANAPLPAYSLGRDGITIAAAPLRAAPDVTPDVVAAYNAAYATTDIESYRQAVGDWFAARCFEMDGLFGLLEDACALLSLAWVCVGYRGTPDKATLDESPHKALAQLQREFDELHLFVYEFELTPSWTIQEWQHQERPSPGASAAHAKLDMIRQSDVLAAGAASDKLLTLLHRGFVSEEDLCSYLTAMDKTTLASFAWASTIIAASCPIASNAPEARYFRSVGNLVTAVLACCFGFVLDGQDAAAGEKQGHAQEFIECAWTMFQTLPKVLPDAVAQGRADELEHLMTGMEILATYGIYKSPKTLQGGAASAAFATDLVERCCHAAATTAAHATMEKLLDDMLQLQEHAFPTALSADATHALVVRSLLATATAPSPLLRQLCPDPRILVDAAKTHFDAAASSTSPRIALALTYFAWVDAAETAEETAEYAAIVHATQWLEQCQGHAIPPAAIMARSPADRLAFVQELLLQRPHQCVQHLAQLPEVANWLNLTEHLLQLWVWAAYAYLQTGHVAEAIQVTISMVGTMGTINEKESYVAQVTSLALDLAALSGGHFQARRDFCRTALGAVPDSSSLLALLESAKQLDAIVQAMNVLQLTDADVALEKTDDSVSISDWLHDQLAVHQEIVHDQPHSLQQSLHAAIQLLLAFPSNVDASSTVAQQLQPALGKNYSQGLPRLVGQLASSLLQSGDVELAVAHLKTLPAAQAYDIWVAACANLDADPTGQAALAHQAHRFFSSTDHSDLAAHFASLQESSKQAADLDALAALLPSLDRSRFEVDHVYRYATLAAALNDEANWPIAFALCDQYHMHRWELCVQFLESLLGNADVVATRDVELKKAQQRVDADGPTLLEVALTQPAALSQRLLHSTWHIVNPYDSIAWEYLWRLCLECHKRSPPTDDSVPVDRLKLLVACAKKLREAGLPVHLAHFCGSVTSPPDATLAVQAAIPLLSGSSIKTLAMLLSKLHGVPASAMILIYMDIIWTHEGNPDLAYEATGPFLSGLTTDHVLLLVHHFLGLPSASPTPLAPLYGHTFKSPHTFGPRLSTAKRRDIACDLYSLVQGRQGVAPADVTSLETQVLWSVLLAFIEAAHIVPASSPNGGFDQLIADVCSQGLSLVQVRVLLQLTSALDGGRDHRPYFQRHVGAMLTTHVPSLDRDGHGSTESNPLHEYLVTKWTATEELPAAAVPPPMTLADVDPVETLFCTTALAWLDDVEPSASTVVLLKWLHELVPPSVCDAFAGNHTSASIVSMLYDLNGNVNWKQYQTQVATDFGAVFALALQHVTDSPAANQGLARVLVQWEASQAPPSDDSSPVSTSWPAELRRALVDSLELDEDAVPLAQGTPLALDHGLWGKLWERRQWAEPALDALLRNTPTAYSSLTDAAATRFLAESGFTAVALLSRFDHLHKAALPLLDWSALTPSQAELVLVRFSLQELQKWPQVSWERLVQHCHRADRLAAKSDPKAAVLGHHALISLLHLVVGFVVEDDFAMASRILCQAAHVHPMLWNTNLYEPLLKQFLAGWRSHRIIDGPRQALVDKLAYLIE